MTKKDLMTYVPDICDQMFLVYLLPSKDLNICISQPTSFVSLVSLPAYNIAAAFCYTSQLMFKQNTSLWRKLHNVFITEQDLSCLYHEKVYAVCACCYHDMFQTCSKPNVTEPQLLLKLLLIIIISAIWWPFQSWLSDPRLYSKIGPACLCSKQKLTQAVRIPTQWYAINLLVLLASIWCRM